MIREVLREESDYDQNSKKKEKKKLRKNSKINLKQKNKRKRFNLERLILSVFGIIFNSMTWLINMYCAKCNRNGANM